MAGTADQTVLLIPVDELHAAADNRVVGNVDDLAASIADLGVLQPLLVEPDPSGGYEVVCGARRLAAAKQAGRDRVPATVRTFVDTKDKLLARACENLNREDLTPLQEAAAYQQPWPSASASTQWASRCRARRATSASASGSWNCPRRPRPPSMPAESASATPSSW